MSVCRCLPLFHNLAAVIDFRVVLEKVGCDIETLRWATFDWCARWRRSEPGNGTNIHGALLARGCPASRFFSGRSR